MSETLESVIIKDLIENLNLWAERYSGKPISLTLFRSSAILGELERERDEAREQNAKLLDIAERAIDDLRWFYEGKSDGLVNELDQLKKGAK